MVKDTKKRIDAVPSQRDSGVTAPTPAVVHVPQQNPATSPLVEVTAARSAAVRRSVWVGIAAGMALSVAAGGAVYAADERAQVAREHALEAHLRVDRASLAAARDVTVEQSVERAVAPAAYADSRAAASATAASVVDH